MKALPPVSNRSLKDLSMSLTFLLFITSAQRCQTVRSLSVNDMHFSNQSYVFQISTKMKQTRPNRHIPPISFKSYPHDTKLCVVTHLSEYLKKRKLLPCSDPQLLVSYIKPYKPVSTQTISHWCKKFWQKAGKHLFYS